MYRKVHLVYQLRGEGGGEGDSWTTALQNHTGKINLKSLLLLYKYLVVDAGFNFSFNPGTSCSFSPISWFSLVLSASPLTSSFLPSSSSAIVFSFPETMIQIHLAPFSEGNPVCSFRSQCTRNLISLSKTGGFIEAYYLMNRLHWWRVNCRLPGTAWLGSLPGIYRCSA